MVKNPPSNAEDMGLTPGWGTTFQVPSASRRGGLKTPGGCAGLSFLARGTNLCFLQSVHHNLEKQVILFSLAGLAGQGLLYCLSRLCTVALFGL